MQTRGRHALTIKNWSDVQERVRAERTGVCFQIPSASGKSPDTAGVRVPTWQAVVRGSYHMVLTECPWEVVAFMLFEYLQLVFF